jgi:hypothetical protein
VIKTTIPSAGDGFEGPASLIESAKVMGEDRLEVVWKFGDVYEKILGEMR